MGERALPPLTLAVLPVGVFWPLERGAEGAAVAAGTLMDKSARRLAVELSSSVVCAPPAGPPLLLGTMGMPAEGGADVKPGGMGMTGVVAPLARPVAM